MANPGYKPAKRMSMVIGIPVDTTGDGVADSMGYDTTGDGQVDCKHILPLPHPVLSLRDTGHAYAILKH